MGQSQTRIYKLIPFPTIEDLQIAADRWDTVAKGRIQYAFGGAFVALLRGGLVEARDIEIILQPGGLQHTTKIKTDNPQYLGITEHNDHVIVVREDDTHSFGVSIRCFEMGTEGFPYYFIPPYESPLRTPEQQNLEPSYYQQRLGLKNNDKYVPVLRPKYLLYQRLFRFRRDQFVIRQSEQKQLQRDILDIRVFLHCAAVDQNEPFSNENILALIQVVRSWKVFAEDNFVNTTAEDVNAWMRLGVPLSLYYDVSAPYRVI
jgi:hypothetical protein